MTNASVPTMDAGACDSRTTRTIMAQVLLAASLCAVVIRNDHPYIAAALLGDPDSAAGIAAPLLAGVVAYRWRRPIAESIGPGSAAGPLLAAVGIAVFMATIWPLNYGTVRIATAMPMLAGALLSIGGRRFLLACLPATAMLLWMIPVGVRFIAAIAIVPETLTIRATRMSLDLLTFADVTAAGPDLVWHAGGAAGTVALGETSRGFSLVLPMMAIGLFVTLASRRSLVGYMAMLGSLVPVVLVCNTLRFVVLGVVTIATESRPEAGEPRVIATVCCFASAYAVFCGIAAFVGGSDPSAGGPGPMRCRWPRGGWPTTATLLILAAAAIAANPAAQVIAQRFHKSAAALREPLATLRDPSIKEIHRIETAADEVRRLADSDVGTPDTLLRTYSDGSKSYMVFVTYYSNQRETIPHTPEVCYRQAGATVNSMSTVQLVLPPREGGTAPRPVEAKLLDIEADGTRRALAYVLCCEGAYHNDRESARIVLGLPGNRRTFFSKIEASAILSEGEDFPAAAQRAASLLQGVIPELERTHFPTQQQLRE